jgi:hypothetical protein
MYFLKNLHLVLRKKYTGPRLQLDTKKIKSVLQYPVVAYERVEHEISLGRIAGSFRFRPIPNWRSSPMGLVPKKSSRWNLLTQVNQSFQDSRAKVEILT